MSGWYWRRCFLAAALGMGCLALPASAEGEWLFDVDAGVLYDNNLTRAQAPADIRGDGVASVSAAIGSFSALSGNDGITLAADLRAEAYWRFHGLNVVGLGGTATYRHKFGVGLDAPWIVGAVTASYDDYQGNVRTGGRYALRAELGRRFSESFDASFGGVYDRRYAKYDQPVVPGISGKPFELSGASAYARASYALNEELLLGAKLEVRRGDVESTARPNLEIFEASSAIAPDPTFGPDFFAYRLRGTTDTATLNGSWALDDRSSINLSYSAERTRAYAGLDYRSWVATISLAYRY
ncbi:MAG TPA: hypothetical protein VKG21_07165 [Casimicrobiaceae bacterium]|nr:hypothetical protein [Casimicrobiaceae bacterium]